jgi:hypothetical protein
VLGDEVVEDGPGFLELVESDDAPASRESTRRGIISADLQPEAERRAQEAASDPGVQAFRRANLENVLLAVEEAVEWIEQRDAEPPPDGELSYLAPDMDWVQRVGTSRGGVLERLGALSESLSARFDWHPALATMFVLTGQTPPLSTRRETVTIPIGGRPKITVVSYLDDDPEAGADVHRAARMRFGITRRRPRKDAERLDVLRAFVEERRPATWPSLLVEWNRMHSEWRYSNPEKIRVAYKRASGRT